MGTVATNFLPSETGLNLGSPTQRWNIYVNTADFGIGSISMGGGSPVSGVVPQFISIAVGSSSSYQTQVTNEPLFYVGVWDSTPWSSGTGYKNYASRVDRTTKAGVDVVSGYAFGAFANVFSTNSTEASNETNQVAIIANASGLSTSSNASTTGINAIASTSYTGALTQTVNPVEADISVNRTAGFFGDPSQPYAVGVSVVNTGAFSASIGVSVDTSTSGIGWLHGFLSGGIINSAFTVVRSTVTPSTGLWVSAAGTYGVYVGAKPLYQVNPGQTPAYDSDHNPSVGIALGQRAANSGQSNMFRLISSSSGGAEQNWDLFHSSAKVLHFQYAGADMIRADDSGNLFSLGDVLMKYNSGGTAYVRLTSTPTSTRIKTLQDTTGTIAELGSAQTWTAQQEYDNNVKIGASGTPLTQVKVYSPSLTPVAVAAALVAEQTFTVSGLTTADKVIVNPPSMATATGISGARVSAPDTLAVRFVNPTSGSLTPDAGVYTVTAFRS